MTQAIYRATGEAVDYTPGSAVTAGDVVNLGGKLGIAKSDIAASTLGALVVCGLYSIVKVTGAISQWAKVYWDADGDPVGGTAGTGAVTTDPSKGPFAGLAVAAAGSSATTVDVLLNEDLPTTPLPVAIADPGDGEAIPVTSGDGYCLIVTAGAETRTIAAPAYVGQRLLISMDTDGGDCVITVAATVNQTGNNTLTFADVDDTIELVGRADSKWSVGFNDGVALTTV